MKKVFSISAAVAAMSLCAVAAPKADPVAEGFPVWQGITPKSHVMGREISASDLRHRVTVVIEIEPGADLKSQLLLASGLVQSTGLASLHGSNWESMELPRNMLLLVSNRGAKDPDAIKAALKSTVTEESTSLGYYRSAMVPFYDDVTFEGGPETAGKRPYFYVMGPTGTEPLAQGRLDAAGVKAAGAAIKKGKSMVAAGGTWRKFYGTADPEHFPVLAKTLEKGKPLKPVAMAILKDVTSKDAERAKESQIVYDALEQTRSELLLRIRLEASACPHRAYYDFQQLAKYWPSEKKKVDDLMNKLKAVPDGEKLAKIFCKVMTWSDPEFTCKNKAEATKIVKELTKMKGMLEKMKESKVIVVQNGALLLDSQIDALIATIPDRVAGK